MTVSCFCLTSERLGVRRWRGRNSGYCSPEHKWAFCFQVISSNPAHRSQAGKWSLLWSPRVKHYLVVSNRQVSKSLLALIGIFTGSWGKRLYGHWAHGHPRLGGPPKLALKQAAKVAREGSGCCCLLCTRSVNKQEYSAIPSALISLLRSFVFSSFVFPLTWFFFKNLT